MDSPFDGCWQRIARAERHRVAIADLWNSFSEEELHDFGAYVDGAGRGRIWVEPRSEFLLHVSLSLGEMLYQLRAALDGAVYTCAVVESGQDPPPKEHNLEFPITCCSVAFNKAAWKIAPLSHKSRAFVESLQPYNVDVPLHVATRTPWFLRILNDWARIDRHRRIHAVLSWVSRLSPMVRVDGARVVSLSVRPEGFLQDGECEIATFELAGWRPGMNVQANPNFAFDIAVNEIPLPGDRSDTFGVRVEGMIRAAAHAVGGLSESVGYGDAPSKWYNESPSE